MQRNMAAVLLVAAAAQGCLPLMCDEGCKLQTKVRDESFVTTVECKAAGAKTEFIAPLTSCHFDPKPVSVSEQVCTVLDASWSGGFVKCHAVGTCVVDVRSKFPDYSCDCEVPTTTVAPAEQKCRLSSECAEDEWCRETCTGDFGLCVKYRTVGERCGGFTPACHASFCRAGLKCRKTNPRIPDLPGRCVQEETCDWRKRCTVGNSCSTGLVCLDNADDQCFPELGHKGCAGCCVADKCRKTRCPWGKRCLLDKKGDAYCARV